MKKIIINVIAFSVLSFPCVASSDRDENLVQLVSEKHEKEKMLAFQQWKRVTSVWGHGVYVKSTEQGDGTKKCVNGVLFPGDFHVTELAPGSRLEESDEEDYKRGSDLDPEISEEMRKRTINMKLTTPSYSPKYLAQQLAKSKRTASHPSYSDFISELGDDAVGGAKNPVSQNIRDRDSDDDSDYQSGDDSDDDQNN